MRVQSAGSNVLDDYARIVQFVVPAEISLTFDREQRSWVVRLTCQEELVRVEPTPLRRSSRLFIGRRSEPGPFDLPSLLPPDRRYREPLRRPLSNRPSVLFRIVACFRWLIRIVLAGLPKRSVLPANRPRIQVGAVVEPSEEQGVPGARQSQRSSRTWTIPSVTRTGKVGTGS